MSNLNLHKEHGITVARRRTSENLLNDQGPYAKLLFDLVAEAIKRRASDIHIEPKEHGIDLRLRVDGNLHLCSSIEVAHRESLILEAKRIFGLSIGISGRPQDGRASLPMMRLDLRVSLLPTHFGEKIVMRLLNLDSKFDLNQLGFLRHEQELLATATRFENGVVVISGPTGSGKTKTLYSLLKAIDPKQFNIVTLEDPIEYRIEGLNQVQVTHKMSFADALRSVLRQDPDVILVGEVRDEETAKLCFQAAETGHLVFTTLHANGAAQVMERLSGLGVNKLVLGSNLRLSIAQRLEQKLCGQCSKVCEPSSQDWTQKLYDKSLLKTKGLGCAQCYLGISGRIPILEWATFECNNSNEQSRIHQTLKDSKVQRIQLGELDCMEVLHDL